jgi:hypothetical protein
LIKLFGHGTVTSPDSETPPPIKPKNSRRRWQIAALSLSGLTLLVVLVIFVLPTPAARYVIETQLDKLGIQHEGIDSVKIDLWNSEVAAGPIVFRSGEAKDGQVGEAGFRYSFANLFDKRAFIEVFFLRGIDLAVNRDEEGNVTLNGIDLAQFAASEDPTEEKADESASSGDSGFGVGIVTFEFSDSRLTFEDFTGGSVTLDLERLTLSDFHSWEPEVPGKFEMESSVNDISVKWEGTATPFAETLEIKLHTSMRDATIDKIARFTGPTGLARQDGHFESDVVYDFALQPNGDVQSTIKGEFRLRDFHIETEQGESVVFDNGRIGLDLVQKIQPQGAKSLGGALDIEIGSVAVQGSAGESVSLNDFAFGLKDFDFSQFSEKREITLGAGEPTASGSGPASTRTIVELLLAEAEAFALKALSHELEIDGSPTISAAGGTFVLPDSEGGPAQEVRFTRFAAKAPDVDSQTVSDGWTVTASFEATLEQAWTGAAGQEQSEGLTASDGNLKAKSIAVETTSAGTSITFDVASSLDSVTLKNSAGLALVLGTVSAGTPGMTVAGDDDRGHIRGPIRIGVENFETSQASETGDLSLSGQAFRFETEDFDLSGGEVLSLALSGALDVGDLNLGKGGETPLALALDSGHIDVKALQIDPLGPAAAINANLASKLTTLDLKLGDGAESQSLGIGDAEIGFDTIKIASSDPLSLGLTGDAILREIAAVVRLANGESLAAEVGQVSLGELETAVEGESFSTGTNIAINGIALKTDADLPQTIDVSGVTVDGLKFDASKGIEISAVAMDQLVAQINDGILALGTGEPGEGAGEAEGAESTDPLPFRLGQASVSSGSEIKVTDHSVEPPMKLEIAIEKAEVGPIDTDAPDTRTKIDLGTTVNEKATIELVGWASPLLPTPDFDLSTDVSRLPLPPFSPYVSSAVGLNIDSGTLDAKAKTSANEGALEGQLDVLVDDLFLESVSDEVDKEFESLFGVSANFATGILKDDKGQIDLAFPISGSVEEPEIDYSDVIAKAVTGAMASLFPLNWFGDDGSSFEILPATFDPGTAELTDDGRTAGDDVGEILAAKPQLRILVCGKATASDLIVLRGGEAPEPVAPESEDQQSDDGAEAGEEAEESAAEQPVQPLAKPSQQEVDQLLDLAIRRGQVMRQYLTESHGVNADRMSECRTSYSIEDGKPPRAEFRF